MLNLANLLTSLSALSSGVVAVLPADIDISPN